MIFEENGREVADVANKTLHMVRHWRIENKSKFAPHKTLGMIITKKIKDDVKMNNVEIKLVEKNQIVRSHYK